DARPKRTLATKLKTTLAVRLSKLVVNLRKRRGSRHNQSLDRLHSPPKQPVAQHSKTQKTWPSAKQKN
ncbi:hypothetical protein, partial [Aeromonas veronii]|uniref:hypothetical protein n=1 Tax=Aeromonas veronii TaxID=654 RepID=UPI0038B68655